MKTKRSSGFTLVEVLIVVVIMAVLAATIIPQFTDSTTDAKASSVKFNLHTLRSQIQLYKAQHNGTPPKAGMVSLIQTTDITGSDGVGASYSLGPYVMELPENPFASSAVVKTITGSPAKSGDVTANNAGGWLYNATTGEVWIDHDVYFAE